MRRIARFAAAVVAMSALVASADSSADTVPARCDVYPRGADRASAVLPCTFSQRQGHVSIDRADGVRHELVPKGDRPGTFVDQSGKPAYRQSGLGTRGQIYRLSRESVYVYWDTAGLQAANPAPVASAAVGTTGSPALTREPAARPMVPLDRTLELNGIRFRVTSANDSSMNRLTIAPSGLQIDNSGITHDVDGSVTGVEVADLDSDGSPEIYVYITSAGSGSYGSLVAYAANRGKSLSRIHLPPIADSAVASRGYAGHDAFAVVESRLVRRFPIYRASDTNSNPTGGTRQLQYKLVPGEAGWVLKLDRLVEY